MKDSAIGETLGLEPGLAGVGGAVMEYLARCDVDVYAPIFLSLRALRNPPRRFSNVHAMLYRNELVWDDVSHAAGKRRLTHLLP